MNRGRIAAMAVAALVTILIVFLLQELEQRNDALRTYQAVYPAREHGRD